MHTLRAIVVALFLGGATSAQIDVHEYLPLGSFDAWRAARTDGGAAKATLRVDKVTLVDGALHYRLAIPGLDGLTDLELVLGVEEGALVMHGARFVTTELVQLSGERMTFDPPIVLGDGATLLDVAPLETAVQTQLVVSVPGTGSSSYGGSMYDSMYESSMQLLVDVTGSIGSSWQSLGADLVTDAGVFPAADLARLVLDFDLQLTSATSTPFEATFAESATAVLARGAGFVQVVNGAGMELALEKAIVPGQTLGDFPALPEATFLGVTAPSEGAFTLHGASDATTTGGEVVLTDVRLEQRLDGRFFVRAGAALVGSLEAPVPVLLKGKARLRTTGDARVVARGKVQLPDAPKAVALSIRQDVTAATTSLAIAYKAGKLLAGEMALGVTPIAADTVALSVLVPVDRKLEPKGTRALGAEGTLTLGTASFAVTALGAVKSKAGQPDRHRYTLAPTGLRTKVIELRGQGVDETDFSVDVFTLKLFGRKFLVPAIDLVVPDVE